MLDIQSIVKVLSAKRPIFHSEADFQHALAWEIHAKYPKAAIRLETNPYSDGQRVHIDILVKLGNKKYAIELKYKTRKLDVEYNDETFHLLNQAAQDIGRYDFIKDLVRIEKFISEHNNSAGIVIFMTNDPGYWKQVMTRDTVDRAFRLTEERILEGQLSWGKLASKGTIKGRKNELILNKNYLIKWNDYSQLENSSKGKFRYLLLESGI